jgi:hypothetical protein
MSITQQDIEVLATGIRALVRDLQIDAQERQRQAAETTPRPRSPIEQKELLHRLYVTYTQRNLFKVGDVVRWKRGMQNRRFPTLEDVGIVVEVLTSPVVSPDNDSGSIYFRELLDVRIGTASEKGDFAIYWFDSSRFELASD